MLLLSSFAESVFQLIVVLLIFIVVLVITYFTTKWIVGYQKAQTYNKNLQVIETIKLTTNKYIQIVRAGEDRFFVIAVGKDEVNLLGELSLDELKELPSEEVYSQPSMDFKSILESFKENIPKK